MVAKEALRDGGFSLMMLSTLNLLQEMSPSSDSSELSKLLLVELDLETDDSILRLFYRDAKKSKDRMTRRGVYTLSFYTNYRASWQSEEPFPATSWET
jgi:hypothetical protein